MTQQGILNVLKDLGGVASAKEIGNEYRKRGFTGKYNPYHLLIRLRKWGLIEYDAKNRIFRIKDKDGMRD